MDTKQANAVASIKDFTDWAQAYKNLYTWALDLQRRQARHDYVTTWDAQPTYAVNADGSAGATDAEPVTTNPMVGINLTAGDLTAVTTYGINDFVSLVEGGAVNAADRRPVFGSVLP